VRNLKDPPARLLDQARVRDGAFDIGMFRSHWERAARLTGERIADLSARPLAPSAESIGLGGDGEAAGPDRATPLPATPMEALSPLSGLISRVLESADLLADATRRTRLADRDTADTGGGNMDGARADRGTGDSGTGKPVTAVEPRTADLPE
jgi:hypothetical protein